MTQSKKYTYRVVQDDTGWTTEIIRRASSKKSIVTKKQGGFATESAAQEWGQTEVKAFLKNLNVREMEKRRAKRSEEKN